MEMMSPHLENRNAPSKTCFWVLLAQYPEDVSAETYDYECLGELVKCGEAPLTPCRKKMKNTPLVFSFSSGGGVESPLHISPPGAAATRGADTAVPACLGRCRKG